MHICGDEIAVLLNVLQVGPHAWWQYVRAKAFGDQKARADWRRWARKRRALRRPITRRCRP